MITTVASIPNLLSTIQGTLGLEALNVFQIHSIFNIQLPPSFNVKQGALCSSGHLHAVIPKPG